MFTTPIYRDNILISSISDASTLLPLKKRQHSGSVCVQNCTRFVCEFLCVSSWKFSFLFWFLNCIFFCSYCECVLIWMQYLFWVLMSCILTHTCEKNDDNNENKQKTNSREKKTPNKMRKFWHTKKVVLWRSMFSTLS